MSLLVSREWIKQNSSFDTNASDTFSVIDVDQSGNTYLAFQTEGTVMGGTKTGSTDIAVSKFDTDGNILWTVQNASFNGGPDGTLNQFPSISTDQVGNVYVGYQTTGTVSGKTKTGATDIVIFKLNGSNGNFIWATQNSTLNASGGSPSTNNLGPCVVAPKNNSSYVFGSYYTNGTVSGQSSPDPSMNTRVVNFRMNATNGSLGPLDQGWVFQSNSVNANIDNTNPCIALDDLLNLYVAHVGFQNITGVTTNTGFQDIIVYKLTTSGFFASLVWIKQNATFNTNTFNTQPSIVVDASYNTFVSYTTEGGSITDGVIILNSFQNTSLVWQPLGTQMRDLLPGIFVDGPTNKTLNVIQIGYINTEIDPVGAKTSIDLTVELYPDSGLSPDFGNPVLVSTVPISYVSSSNVITKNVLTSVLNVAPGFYWLKIGPANNPKWRIEWAQGDVNGFAVSINYYYDEIGTMQAYPNDFMGTGCANLLVKEGNVIPVSGSTNTSPIGSSDIIVFQLGTTGTTDWVKQSPLQNTNGVNNLSSIAVKNDGYLYLAYDVSGSASFPFYQSTGSPNVAISKMRKTDGDVIWTYVQSLWNSTLQNNYPKIGLDQNYNIYVSYYTNGIAPSIGSSVGSNDIVLFKLNQISGNENATNVQYLLYNDQTKEITYNTCIPQGRICDIETICCVDPTSTFEIGNTPEITNIINNAAYSPGWLGYMTAASTTSFNSGDANNVPFSPMVCSAESDDCSTDNNYFKKVFVIGTNGQGRADLEINNGPSGLSTGLTLVIPSLLNPVSNSETTKIVCYDASGNANWVGLLGYTGIGSGTTITDSTMRTGGVSSYQNSVYMNCLGTARREYYIFNGPTGSGVGLTGFGGIGLTGTSTLCTPTSYLTKFDLSGIAEWTTRVANSTYRTFSRTSESLSCHAYKSSVCQVGTSRSATGLSGQLLVYNGPLGQDVGITGPAILNNNYGYTVKYNTSGKAQWMGITTVDSTSTETRVKDVTMDEEENVYICGTYFCSSTTTPPFQIQFFNRPNGSNLGLTGTTMPLTDTNVNSFVAKYSSNGNILWFKKIYNTGASASVNIQTISYSNQGVYVSGKYEGAANIFINEGPAPNNLLLTACNGVSGTNDAFVAKFNSSGTPEWVGRIAGPDTEDRTGASIISVDATPEGCYVNCNVGIPSGSAGVFNVFSGPTGSGTPTISATYSAVIGVGVVVVKYNSNGIAQWIVRFANLTTGGNFKSYGVSANRNGIYFLSDLTGTTTSINNPKTLNYYTRNDGTLLSKTYFLPPTGGLNTKLNVVILNKIDFSANIQPVFTLKQNNLLICPTNKNITYRSNNSNPVRLDVSGLNDPSFGPVAGLTATSTGSNLKLLYNPTSNNDWFINKNNGFQPF